MTTDRISHPARRPTRLALGLMVAAALALVGAACSSSGKAGTSTGSGTSSAASGAGPYAAGTPATSPATSSTAGSGGGDVQVASSDLGQIVVDSQGRTLYMYVPDSGPTSTCLDACAAAWPPAAVTGTPTAGSGVTGALTTTTRPDGSTQLVLNGHPLYRYSGDQSAGDTNGQDIGGIWYVLSPDGSKVGD